MLKITYIIKIVLVQFQNRVDADRTLSRLADTLCSHLSLPCFFLYFFFCTRTIYHLSTDKKHDVTLELVKDECMGVNSLVEAYFK